MSSGYRSLLTLLLYVLVKLSIGVGWHLVLFKEVLDATTPFARPEPIIPLGAAAVVLHGILLIAVYPRFHREDSRVRSGLRFGAAAGLYLAAGATWVDVAKFEFVDAPIYFLLETVYEVSSSATLGLLIALRYEPAPSATATPALEPSQ